MDGWMDDYWLINSFFDLKKTIIVHLSNNLLYTKTEIYKFIMTR